MTETPSLRTQVDGANRSPETRRLEKQSMRNWYLLASICAVSTVGLLVAVTPALRQSIAGFWPWAATDIVLLVGLGGSILLLVLHMTVQQLKVTSMRHRVQYMEAKVLERRRQNASRFHALLNVSRMMGAVSDLSSLFEGLTKTCLEIFDCQQASIMLLNTGTNMLELKAAAGHVNQENLRDIKQPVGKGIAGYVAQTRKPVVLGKDNRPEDYPGLRFRALNLTAAMVVPILVRDELVGVLNISSRMAGTVYGEDDLKALQIFAENAGSCIRQAERAEWMRQTIERQQRQMSRERQHQPD
jgi:transcriptional regulator with GAF, ATPase, and Fis domain